jgi:Ca2+-binding RTX toxin-like protein
MNASFADIEKKDKQDASETSKQRKKIIGTAGNDRLKGTDDQDVIRGLNGNDKLIGYIGNDRLVGGKGDDVLDGFAPRFVFTSLPAIAVGDDFDTLTGGSGADKFILGKVGFLNSFYSQRGYATITDFKQSQGDTIQILDRLDQYQLVTQRNYGGSSAKDTAIFREGNLIAVVYDVTNLTAQDFTSVFNRPFILP